MSELEPQRPRDFLMGFAAGMLACEGCYYADGPGWGSVAELLAGEEELAQPLMERWLLEGSDEFGPLIEAYHQRVLDRVRAANEARDAARAARRADESGGGR